MLAIRTAGGTAEQFHSQARIFRRLANSTAFSVAILQSKTSKSLQCIKQMTHLNVPDYNPIGRFRRFNVGSLATM
ncbi:hypothetical protein, partial [Providencia stuartii]|uniref:hypothetical protein n=1 Tax=Providencia stuartii TaxID=588 RepID=UPI001C68A814